MVVEPDSKVFQESRIIFLLSQKNIGNLFFWVLNGYPETELYDSTGYYGMMLHRIFGNRIEDLLRPCGFCGPQRPLTELLSIGFSKRKITKIIDVMG